MDALNYRLKVFSAILLALLLVSSAGFMIIEKLQPIDALYFTIVTMATVGYGDIHPTTVPGKILAVIVILTGVGTFVGVFANTADVLLSKRERRMRREKLNTVIGIFFGEVGTELLTRFSASDSTLKEILGRLMVSGTWTEKDFSQVGRDLIAYDYAVTISAIDLPSLKSFLLKNTALFLRILENPYLLEHEIFTELMRAVLHLKDELSHRDEFISLPETDLQHLTGDIRRVYSLLSQQWVDYMEYLQKNYPYLFSLAIRLNPFNPDRSPVVY